MEDAGLHCSWFGSLTNSLALVGAVCVVYWVLLRAGPYLLQTVFIYVLGRCWRHKLLQTSGRWAVVTGCTDGIGKAFAEQLARLGLNIVLISRNSEKLADQARNIGSQYRVQTRTITADFTRQDIYPNIAIQLNGLQIGVLVNNVGMGMDPELFTDISHGLEDTHNMLNVNIFSVAMMTGLVLPAMVARKKGIIINVSSAAGCRPVPFMSLYSSTKAFVNNFTEALAWEYADSGVIIQAMTPYLVATKMSNMRSNVLIPTPDDYAKQALQSVGSRTLSTGYFTHDLQHLVATITPMVVLRLFLLSFQNVKHKLASASNNISV